MRLTLNYVPCSADMTKTSGMPLAVVLQPLALPGPEDDQLPVTCLTSHSSYVTSALMIALSSFCLWCCPGRRG